MPTTKAAAKALRQTKKRTAANAKARAEISVLRTQVIHAARGGDGKKAKEILQTLQKKIDKSVKVGRLKKIAGSRIKSRMATLAGKAK